MTYLHGHHESVLRSHRSRTAENSAGYLLPHLRLGQRLLDIGSGPGTITADLAEIVGPDATTALEVSAEALALTTAELGRRGLAGVTGVVGDVHALPFEDGSFDVVHAHQVLQHLADPVGALREMARITAPGGLIAARDSDYGMFTWHPAVPALTEWLDLYHQLARRQGFEPDAGRYFRAWANAAGLTDVTITHSSWTYATPDAVAWWSGLWHDRALASEFATQARAAGVDDATLERIASGWTEWGTSPDALFVVPSAELIARKAA